MKTKIECPFEYGSFLNKPNDFPTEYAILLSTDGDHSGRVYYFNLAAIAFEKMNPDTMFT